MEKFILELIRENNRVIIPNFGAFIISKENGLSILFNNFLSFNDGLLVNYIAEKEALDTIVATDKVFEFVDQLKKKLDEEGEYRLQGLGAFKREENGVLRFIQDEKFSDNYVGEIQEQEAPEEELLDLDKTEEISEIAEEQTEEVSHYEPEKEEVEDSQMLTLDSEDKHEEFVVNETTEEPVKLEEEKTIEENVEENESVVSEPNKYVVKAKEENKRKMIVTFVVLSFFAIIVAGYFLFFNDSENAKEEESSIVIQVEEPEVKEQTDTLPEVIEEEVKVEIVEEIEQPVTTETEFNKKEVYIIVGGFENESNAIKLKESLISKGYTKSIIIPKGNLFLVSIDSDVSYKKMELRQQEILSNEKMESWMYRIK